VNARSILTCCVVLASLGGMAGCKGLLKKKDADPAASATAAAATPPAPVASAVPAATAEAPVPAPVALDENAVPAPQDFEDEAAEKVTTANFKAELARLQKEIGQ
jgi:hypothetical protein